MVPTDVVTCVTSPGNTDTGSSLTKNKIGSRSYCFTLYEYNEFLEDLINFCDKNCTHYCLGHEICPSTGKQHLQGYIKLTKMMRFDTLKKYPFFCNGHFEKPRGTMQHNFDYCSKEGNYKSKGFAIKVPIKINEDLRPWMKEIERVLKEEPDNRTILWLYDPIGNIGKTQFLKYLVVKYKYLFTTGGKASDVANLVFNNREYFECTNRGVCVFDIPRCSKGHISYNALEMIKNGMVTNTKFECGNVIFNSPHVCIFSNDLPDVTKMSSDRWLIYTVKNWELIKLDPDNLYNLDLL